MHETSPVYEDTTSVTDAGKVASFRTSKTPRRAQPQLRQQEGRGMKRRAAMERSYVVLERKLDQLQTLIRELCSQADDGPSSGSRFVGVEDIRKQFGFLSTLLAAEKDCHSHAEDIPRHLRHISERFDGLQGVFRDWEVSPVPPAAFVDDDLSTCSCNHECFREPEAEEDDAPETEPESELVVPEEEAAEGVEDEEEEEVQQQEEEVQPDRRRSGRRCGFISAAVAVVLVVMGLVANFHWVEEEVYLVPT